MVKTNIYKAILKNLTLLLLTKTHTYLMLINICVNFSEEAGRQDDTWGMPGWVAPFITLNPTES